MSVPDLDPGGDRRPVPDPTKLTTDQLRREIAAVRELLEAQIELVRADMHGHWSLDEERYASVARRFHQEDATRLEQKADSTKALDAALAVVRQEHARIEATTLRLIETTRDTSRAEWVGLSAQVSDQKDQLAAMRAVRQGGNESRTSLFAGLAAVVALLSLVALVFSIVTAHP